MINGEALLDGFLVVIAATTHLATFHKSVDELLLGNFKTNHGAHASATLVEQCFQSLGLRDGAGEAVKNHAVLRSFLVVVDNLSKDAYHQLIGD